MPETLIAKVAREYRIKFGADMPNLTLARILKKENPELYTSVDMARSALRRIEGKQGQPKDKSLVIKRERPKNPYNLPESESEDFSPLILDPKTHKRILLLSDIHIPYHHIDAITLAIDYGKERDVDTIILNGDTIDFYMLSRFEKDPRKRSVSEELEATRQFFKILREQFPKAMIIFKEGNHDLRFRKYLLIRAPELLGVQEIDIRNLLKMNDFKIEFVEDKRMIKILKLNILHGHEYPSAFSPVNIARGLFMKATACAIQGHNHATSENTVTTLDGDMITTWSTGCLCDLKPGYLPYNKWNLGFAYIEVGDNTYEVHNKRIKNGKVF